jgi:hypothetical protein
LFGHRNPERIRRRSEPSPGIARRFRRMRERGRGLHRRCCGMIKGFRGSSVPFRGIAQPFPEIREPIRGFGRPFRGFREGFRGFGGPFRGMAQSFPKIREQFPGFGGSDRSVWHRSHSFPRCIAQKAGRARRCTGPGHVIGFPLLTGLSLSLPWRRSDTFPAPTVGTSPGSRRRRSTRGAECRHTWPASCRAACGRANWVVIVR